MEKGSKEEAEKQLQATIRALQRERERQSRPVSAGPPVQQDQVCLCMLVRRLQLVSFPYAARILRIIGIHVHANGFSWVCAVHPMGTGLSSGCAAGGCSHWPAAAWRQPSEGDNTVNKEREQPHPRTASPQEASHTG